MHGWWRLEDLGDGRTRATYGLEVDPGRMLGMLLRGPVEGKVRDYLVGGRPRGSRSAPRLAERAAPGRRAGAGRGYGTARTGSRGKRS